MLCALDCIGEGTGEMHLRLHGARLVSVVSACVAAITVLMCGVSRAEFLQMNAAGTTPGVGSVVIPRFANLPAQNSPPNFLGLEGAKVGTLTPNQPYIVLQQKAYPSFSGDPQQWFNVAPLQAGPAKQDPSNQGQAYWVYFGQAGSEGNLTQCNAACLGLASPDDKSKPLLQNEPSK